MTESASGTAPIAFLFLGETLLIPHLYPVVEALIELAPRTPIDLWVSTSVHEDLIVGWLARGKGQRGSVRIRRVPGFLVQAVRRPGDNPRLPHKFATLLRLAPYLLGSRVIVCAEQTSLRLAQLLPFLRWRFVKAAHGAGSMMSRDDPRRRAAFRLMVPAAAERMRLISKGIDPGRICVVGYVKSAFHGLTKASRCFPDEKPVVVYTPHWQQARSSWWSWGPRIVAMLAEQDRYNFIFAPHLRLAEKAPELRGLFAELAGLAHVHVDLDSMAMVDGSYMAAADIYLGDTSSQVVEFLIRPRPCVFLNAQQVEWRTTDEHGFWECGDVIDRFDAIFDAIDRAPKLHPDYQARQRSFVEESLGDTGPQTAMNAAQCVLDALYA